MLSDVPCMRQNIVNVGAAVFPQRQLPSPEDPLSSSIQPAAVFAANKWFQTAQCASYENLTSKKFALWISHLLYCTKRNQKLEVAKVWEQGYNS